MSGSTELWCVGAAHRASACLVSTLAVDEILVLYDVCSFRQTVEVIVRGVVARCAIRTAVPAAHLTDRLHAGSTFVKHLYEVIVAVGSDGDTYTNPVAHFEL